MACLGGMKNAYNIPVGAPEENSSFGRRKLICEGVDWI
jgi:hypothetical protein